MFSEPLCAALNVSALTQLQSITWRMLSEFLWQSLKEHFSKTRPSRSNEIKLDYELHCSPECSGTPFTKM